MNRKDHVQLILSILNQHRDETQNFTIPPHTLTYAELIGMKPVTDALLHDLPKILYVFHPKELPKIRRAIAYLTDLKERQSAAWQNECARWDKQMIWVQKRLQQLEGKRAGTLAEIKNDLNRIAQHGKQ